jgi:hypothetical protein
MMAARFCHVPALAMTTGSAWIPVDWLAAFPDVRPLCCASSQTRIEAPVLSQISRRTGRFLTISSNHMREQ